MYGAPINDVSVPSGMEIPEDRVFNSSKEHCVFCSHKDGSCSRCSNERAAVVAEMVGGVHPDEVSLSQMEMSRHFLK